MDGCTACPASGEDTVHSTEQAFDGIQQVKADKPLRRCHASNERPTLKVSRVLRSVALHSLQQLNDQSLRVANGYQPACRNHHLTQYTSRR